MNKLIKWKKQVIDMTQMHNKITKTSTKIKMKTENMKIKTDSDYF